MTSKADFATSDEKVVKAADDITPTISVDHGEVFQQPNHLHRRLGNRQIQLLAIGGSIGTSTFVSIGFALYKAGPVGLLLGYTLYSCLVALVNNSVAEMVIFMPVAASFIRHSSKWVDEAWGFMAGWNFFFYEAILVPFEITALGLVLSFWSDDIPIAAVCAGCSVAYGLINILPVKYYGETEFWLSSGKIVLMGIVFSFTFVTMVGGNPQHDAYGFRYWKVRYVEWIEGPFVEYLAGGNLGKFEGFLAALWQAAFSIVGPEYIAMVAGEAKLPRWTSKKAYKTIYARFAFMFIGSALCVAIVIPSNDPTLVAILTGESKGSGTGAASPYIIAMSNMGISVLPHIVNALLVTSIFSAGNTYFFCAVRTLHGLATAGHAPKILQKCTKNGTPYLCCLVVMLFPFLSFLQVSNSSAVVLTWLINLVTAATLIDYIVMLVNYLFFYRALKAQNFDRRTLPYRGYFQPYSTWIALVLMVMILGCYGYTTFLPGHFTVADFLSYYAMVFVDIILLGFWKFFKRSKMVQPAEADMVWDRPMIDRYEESCMVERDGFWSLVSWLARQD